MSNGRVRGITRHVDAPIEDGWQLASSAPGLIEDPTAAGFAGLAWVEATKLPTTAAASLAAAGQWSLDGPPRRFDAEDWWWRVRFSGSLGRDSSRAGPGEEEEEEETLLCFDGLATIAEVWLNGTRILQSDNMFVAHRVAVTLEPSDEKAKANELIICCRSIDARLAMKRPRPRWRAPMVEHPQLRWIRTTLLGRTPGWSPPAAVVGPWRPVRLVRRRHMAIDDVSVRVQVEGTKGIVDLKARVKRLDGSPVTAGTKELIFERNGREHRAPVTLRDVSPFGLVGDGGYVSIIACLTVDDVERWWPHTHGEPALYRARLEMGEGITVDLGSVGFRSIAMIGGAATTSTSIPPSSSSSASPSLGDPSSQPPRSILPTSAAAAANEGFALIVNEVPIFCRGACWTPLDILKLVVPSAPPDASHAYDDAIAQATRAGMNMLRASGTMVYESDAFFDAADRAGVLVWQDLMFANMDYPEEDVAFASSIAEEVRQQLRRLEARPCVAVVCGNSEGEQQAAMWGASRDRWSPKLFHETLAKQSHDLLPDVPYWPSSAHGGAFPHQADRGTTSYYGVGAYLRPLEDARRADVRFATECLAFANISAPKSMARMPDGGASLKAHHPSWKMRTPRDLGAGWDFDDVRDHYVARLFGVDPAELRYADHDRYCALGRVVTGEVMAQVFGEWRRARSNCAGGLVWFLRDLWTGAGWGIIGADGEPKVPYHYLRRILAPIALHITDEGGNGLYVHVFNDSAGLLKCELALTLFRGDVSVGTGKAPIVIEPRSALEVPVLSLFEGFLDINHAYRFGPPACDLVVAQLRLSETSTIEAFHFPVGLPSKRSNDLGLTAELRKSAADVDVLYLHLTTRSFAQSIAIEIDGFSPDDNFFHLAPGKSRAVMLRRTSPTAGARGTVTALNAESELSVTVP